MGIFIGEDSPNVWIKTHSMLRQIVTLANKIDKYKGKVSLSRGKLILDEKEYGVKKSA